MYDNAATKDISANLSLSTTVTLNPATGQLTFSDQELWLSCLKAVNDQGSSIFLFGFEITNVSPPPIIANNGSSIFDGENISLNQVLQLDLNTLITNIGGPITQWQEISQGSERDECIMLYNAVGLEEIPDQLSLPDFVTLNTATGLLTFNYGGVWFGCLKATNSQGASIFILGFDLAGMTATE
jgi:hypothetical protein